MKKILFIAVAVLAAQQFCLAQHGPDTYNEISLPALMEKMKKGDKSILVLDVRSPGEYSDSSSRNMHLNLGHIKGAINLDIMAVETNPDTIKSLNKYKDRDIYVICSHSYRSRRVSNVLLQNGFKQVTNVQGGMSEWFRMDDELKPYRKVAYESTVKYKNLSPSELFQLKKTQSPILIGINNTPRYFWDSANAVFYSKFPDFNDTKYFTTADSMKILELAKSANGKPIVTFNTTNSGAAEMTDWLMKKGIPNTSYLVGNLYGYYEYLTNHHQKELPLSYLKTQSAVKFITAENLCEQLGKNENLLMVDTRHDTIFNKISGGTKHDYKHLKGSVNFPYYKGAAAFESGYADKNKIYVFISPTDETNLNLADELARKGYRIEWLMGGQGRWEWYVNNEAGFKCADYFVK
jgi:rhodanese-related sulfurtransferase